MGEILPFIHGIHNSEYELQSAKCNEEKPFPTEMTFFWYTFGHFSIEMMMQVYHVFSEQAVLLCIDFQNFRL